MDNNFSFSEIVPVKAFRKQHKRSFYFCYYLTICECGDSCPSTIVANEYSGISSISFDIEETKDCCVLALQNFKPSDSFEDKVQEMINEEIEQEGCFN